MSAWLERTRLLLGDEKIAQLKHAHVLVVGLGGVGAHAAEHICRAGVGNMTIVDGDTIAVSNINRQLPATHLTLGEEKTEVMGARLRSINPDLNLRIINEYIRDERMIEILDEAYDYVVDAIDTLSPKIYLIYHCIQKGLPLVSSMGSGGKSDPSRVLVGDISETYNCRLAQVLRKRLHRMGIYKGFKAVYSTELVERSAVVVTEGEQNKKSNVGTISYMPPLFGIYCASVVVRSLMDRIES